MYVRSFMHAAEVNLAIEQKAQIRFLANIGLKKKKMKCKQYICKSCFGLFKITSTRSYKLFTPYPFLDLRRQL